MSYHQAPAIHSMHPRRFATRQEAENVMKFWRHYIYGAGMEVRPRYRVASIPA